MEDSVAAVARVRVAQGHKVAVEQLAQVVPLPVALVLVALQRQTLGQTLTGADDVVDAPLELALGNAAEVQRDLGSLPLFERDGTSAYGLLPLQFLIAF